MRSSTVNIRIHLDDAGAAERIRARGGASEGRGLGRELAETLRRVIPTLIGRGTGRTGGIFDPRDANVLGMLGRAFDGVGDSLGRLVPRLKGFGTLLRQVMSDLFKLSARSLLGKMLGGGGGVIGGRGGGIAGSLIGGLLGAGGRTAPGALALGSGLAGAGGLLGGGAAAAGGGLASAGAGMSSAAASGGGGMFAGMGALFTNPWTAVVAGGIVASLLLWKHFSNRTEKKLRDAVKSTYADDIKEMSVLKQIKEVGEQAFGKGQVSKHLLDTVKLDGAKTIIQGYAESTNQTASKLVTEAQLKDPGWAGNQMIRREFGGPVRAGVPYIVGERRPEVFVPESNGMILPSVPSRGSSNGGNQGGGSSGMPAWVGVLLTALQLNTQASNRMIGIPAGQFAAIAANENPVAFSDGATEGWSKSGASRDRLAKKHKI